MFTGIVEESGVVESIKPAGNAIQLVVRARLCGRGMKIGGSLALNGCCLTITKIRPRGRDRMLQFDLLAETWERANWGRVRPGSAVNLERPVAAGAQMGGHFVTGHVDGAGKIIRWERSGRDHVLDIAAPPEIMRYIVPKGSVALDGISLTVAAAHVKSFRIWIIPHTLDVTALRERRVGDTVNLEADILGKYVERFIAADVKRKVRHRPMARQEPRPTKAMEVGRRSRGAGPSKADLRPIMRKVRRRATSNPRD